MAAVWRGIAVLLVLAATEACVYLAKRRPATDPELLPAVELIKYHGYPAEEHTVTSEDGYLTTLHRVPYSKSSPSRAGRPVVVLFHGLLGTSVNWLELGPNQALGFLLADAGYDVWLTNSRGSLYSRRHVTLSPGQPQFWNFSFHEMGYYDLPPTVDYILDLTGQSQLSYIGHSLGCAIFFVMTSLRPEYNIKVRLMVALGPSTFVGDVRAPLFKFLKKYHNQVAGAYLQAPLHEVLPYNDITATIMTQVCAAGHLQLLCAGGFEQNFGLSSQHLTKGILTKILAHYPGGTSLNVLEHLLQLHYSGEFSEYEPQFLGRIGAFRKHHKSQPYNLGLVTAPVAIYFAQEDVLVDPKTVQQLAKKVRNVTHVYKIPSKSFNHVDFIFAKDAKTLVYNHVIRTMNEF